MSINRKNHTLIFILCLVIGLFSLTSFAIAQDDGETTPEPAEATEEAVEATAEATFEPVVLDIDYTIPVDPDVDLSLVVARVGDLELTLADFQARNRFERFIRVYVLEGFIQENLAQGATNILDLDDPANANAPAIQNFMEQFSDINAIAGSAYRSMVITELYWQEAEARGVEVSTCDANTIWGSILQIQLFDCETLTPEFQTAKSTFIARASAFTGMTPEEVDRAILGFVIGDTVAAAIGEDTEVAIYNTRHIRVADAETADAIHQQLVDGTPFYDVFVEYAGDPALNGNGGELPALSNNGQLTQAFADAMFAAEPGVLTGPVQTEFGWHVIEVLEQFPGRHIRHILLPTESDANAAIGLLDDGVDFAEITEQYSLDQSTQFSGGDLGVVTANNASLPEALVQAVFEAEVFAVVGPIETERGFHVVEILEEVPAQEVSSRHILVETEEEAQAALARIEAGEDFAYVANDVSIDFSMGARGYTLVSLGGQATSAPTAYYSLNALSNLEPQLADALEALDLQVGDILEPIETVRGFYVVVVLGVGSRLPTQPEIEEIVFDWQDEQLNSDRVMQTELWRYYAVSDPLPSAVNSILEPLDLFVQTGIEEAQANYLENLIPSFLLNLDAPEIVATEDVDAETTPEPEATEVPDGESTPEPEITPEPEMTPEATAESEG